MLNSHNHDQFNQRLIATIRDSLNSQFKTENNCTPTAQLGTSLASEHGLVKVFSDDSNSCRQISFHVESDDGPLTLMGALPSYAKGGLDNLLLTTANLLEKEVLLARSERSVDEYTAQISRDFEVLVWVRDLAQHLQQSDVRAPLSEIVLQVFAPLLNAIQASQIVVGLHARPIGLNASIPEIASTTVQAFGKSIIAGDSIQKILSQYGKQSRQKVVVNNHANSLDICGLNSFILLPITNHKSEFGWILAVNRADEQRDILNGNRRIRQEFHQEEFGTFEVSVLQSTAISLATQAQNAFLHQEEESLLIGVVRALVNAVEAKDTDTGGHSDRVARVSKRIGQQLGLDAKTCEQSYLAGLLHDIGKIGISDKVLLKRGRLTHDEYEQLKQHPVIGYNVLKHLDRVSYVLPGVLYHHESYDGSGYPEGRVGEAIPLFARIIAVADAFDAMTSDRPYRNGMPVDRAEARLRANYGPQWDQGVVDAFFAVTEDIYAICFPKNYPVADLQPQGSAADSITNAVGAAF